MEQKYLEAKLMTLEAEYVEKKSQVDNIIRQHKIELEAECLRHNKAVSEYKMMILSKEKDLVALKKEYISMKAEIFQEFAESDE